MSQNLRTDSGISQQSSYHTAKPHLDIICALSDEAFVDIMCHIQTVIFLFVWVVAVSG